jgi:uncharacterized protein YbaR (Trm112 family)
MGLLKRLAPTPLLVALDSLAQLTGDWWQLSPSVFVRSIKVQGDTVSPDEGLVFRCPECGHYPLTNGESVEEGDGELACANCARRYPIQDGIYDFRLNLL